MSGHTPKFLCALDRRTRFRIVVNPKSGSGKAFKIYRHHVEPFLRASGCQITQAEDPDRTNLSVLTITQAAGEAKDIAKNLDPQKYDVIVCIGGDGIVHEVINGFANRPDSRTVLANVPIAVIPAGILPPLSAIMLPAPGQPAFVCPFTDS